MNDKCEFCNKVEPPTCPVFIDCVADRIKEDDKMALDSALLLWDKYHWPLKILAVMGKLLTKYRTRQDGSDD